MRFPNACRIPDMKLIRAIDLPRTVGQVPKSILHTIELSKKIADATQRPQTSLPGLS
jgi:hypothetical protein